MPVYSSSSQQEIPREFKRIWEGLWLFCFSELMVRRYFKALQTYTASFHSQGVKATRRVLGPQRLPNKLVWTGQIFFHPLQHIHLPTAIARITVFQWMKGRKNDYTIHFSLHSLVNWAVVCPTSWQWELPAVPFWCSSSGCIVRSLTGSGVHPLTTALLSWFREHIEQWFFFSGLFIQVSDILITQ